MTTTHITNIAHRLDISDYAGAFVEDYDMEKINAEYLEKINQKLPVGIVVAANGDVISDLEVAGWAREIYWDEITNEIDVDEIFERNDNLAKTD